LHDGSGARQPRRRFLDPLSLKPPVPVAHTGYILNLKHAKAPPPLQFADSAGYGGGAAMSAFITASAGAHQRQLLSARADLRLRRRQHCGIRHAHALSAWTFCLCPSRFCLLLFVRTNGRSSQGRVKE
jgi:hypothetical protein